MRADTKTISIDADPGKVFRFLVDPAHLSSWAVGFAKAVRRDGERWVVTTKTARCPSASAPIRRAESWTSS